MSSPEQNPFGITYVVPAGQAACLNPDDNLVTVDHALTYHDTLKLLIGAYGNEHGVLPDNFATEHASTVACYFASPATLPQWIRDQLNINV